LQVLLLRLNVGWNLGRFAAHRHDSHRHYSTTTIQLILQRDLHLTRQQRGWRARSSCTLSCIVAGLQPSHHIAACAFALQAHKETYGGHRHRQYCCDTKLSLHRTCHALAHRCF
jgi:hypothetical protein